MDVHLNARGIAVPGVLFHASIASNIMKGDFIFPVPFNHLVLSLLSAIVLVILLAWICENFYIFKSIKVQRNLLLGLPILMTAILVILGYQQGGHWRSLIFFGAELALLLPISILRFGSKSIKIDVFEAYELSDKSIPQYTILTQAPRPMALAYERHLQSTSDKAQHSSTVFEERVVRFMGLVHLCVLYRSGVKVDQKFVQAITNDTHNFLRPLAAGTCIGLGVHIRKLLKAAGDDRFFKFQDPEAFRDSFLKERQAGGHYDIGNKEKGPVAFEHWLVRYFSATKFRLFVYLGHELIADEEYFVFEYLGGVQRLGKQRIKSNLKLELEHIYLINAFGVMIDLYPFIVYRPYVETQAQEVCELYQINAKGKVVYKSLSGAETVELDDPGLAEVTNLWSTQITSQKRELPVFRELYSLLDDELKPWSVGDRVLDDWLIEMELMRQHGGYWYQAKRYQTLGNDHNAQCYLNFYLKGTAAYEKIAFLKDRLEQKLEASFVWRPSLYSESSKGFWVQYPMGRFVFETKIDDATIKELNLKLNLFHETIGPHSLLSKRSFIYNEDGQIFITPGLAYETHQLKGLALERMVQKLKDREVKFLEEMIMDAKT